MKIVIAGGTGLIGSYLCAKFKESGNEVLIVSRRKENGHVSWDSDELKLAVDGSDLLINLAGKTINCRHSKKNMEAISNSRLKATEKIGNVLLSCKMPPKLWINASASAIYSTNSNVPLSETSTDFAENFLSNVVREWEKVFLSFRLPATRQIALRTSVVLSKSGGAFLPLYWLSKLGLGGKQGSGNQVFSWVHIEDYFRIIQFLFQNEVKGIVNCTSPQPIANFELMKSFRKSIGQPIGLPAPEFLIKIGALLIGTESSLLLNSSNLYPQVLLDNKFEFKFSTIDAAIADLINK